MQPDQQLRILGGRGGGCTLVPNHHFLGDGVPRDGKWHSGRPDMPLRASTACTDQSHLAIGSSGKLETLRLGSPEFCQSLAA